MKVKNLMFSGFMAAILTGVACSADAAVVASKEYVDARETSIMDTVEQTYQKSADAVTEEDVQEKITAAVGTAEEGLIKDVADNKDEISSLKAKDTELAGKIQANTEAIAILDGGEGAEGSIANLTTKINNNASAIEILNSNESVGGSVANQISTALKDYDTSAQVDGKISTALEDYDTSTAVDTKIKNASDTLTTEINKKQNEITGDQLKALNSGITAEKVTNYDNYATTKQDIMSAGNDYVSIENNKVSVNVNGEIEANNTGLITGGIVYTYAIPKPTNCKETTCVLSVNGDNQPYWMKLELASSGSSDPETTSN